MRTIIALLAVFAALAGLYFLVDAFLMPSNFQLGGANAIQLTQVYTMATYRAVLSIACFAFTGLCIMTSRGMAEEAKEFKARAEARGVQVK
jgi:hypothetical protein